jgi:hypothetical protein
MKPRIYETAGEDRQPANGGGYGAVVKRAIEAIDMTADQADTSSDGNSDYNSSLPPRGISYAGEMPAAIQRPSADFAGFPTLP